VDLLAEALTRGAESSSHEPAGLFDDLRDLYQEVILDHGRKPRNFRRLDDATPPRAATTRCAATGSSCS
jgi:hypothetical protein